MGKSGEIPLRTTEAAGIGRSLRIYYGDPARDARMDALYSRYLGPDSLAFDIGAHVGDRTAAFRRLGARVVTVEPQRAAMRALRLIHGRDRRVTLIKAAIGARPGQAEMRVNTANPTVSSLSGAFVDAADGAAGWEGQTWDGRQTVPVTTLDALIAEHGCPDFLKLDIEGFEEAALAGLSAPVPALSLEITLLQRDTGLAALSRLAALGPYEFAFSLGEELTPDAGGWHDHPAIAARIAALPDAANSGDLYARRILG